MTRTMTLAHRTEVMDAHIGDNNWKKTIGMGEAASVLLAKFSEKLTKSPSEASLCKKWKKICSTRLENIEDFEIMNISASPEQRSTWNKMAQDADQQRLTEIKAMDIYNIDLPKGMYVLVTLLLKQPAKLS